MLKEQRCFYREYALLRSTFFIAHNNYGHINKPQTRSLPKRFLHPHPPPANPLSSLLLLLLLLDEVEEKVGICQQQQ